MVVKPCRPVCQDEVGEEEEGRVSGQGGGDQGPQGAGDPGVPAQGELNRRPGQAVVVGRGMLGRAAPSPLVVGGVGQGGLLNVFFQLLHVPLEFGATVLEPTNHLK